MRVSPQKVISIKTDSLKAIKVYAAIKKALGVHLFPFLSLYYKTNVEGFKDAVELTDRSTIAPWVTLPCSGAKQWIEWTKIVTVVFPEAKESADFTISAKTTASEFASVVIEYFGKEEMNYGVMYDFGALYYRKRCFCPVDDSSLSAVSVVLIFVLVATRVKYSSQKVEFLMDKIVINDDNWMIWARNDRAVSKYSIIRAFDSDATWCSGRLEDLMERLNQKVINNKDDAEMWNGTVRISILNLHKKQRVIAPAVDHHESLRRLLVNEVLETAILMLQSLFDIVVHMDTEYPQNTQARLPDTATGWGVLDYYVKHTSFIEHCFVDGDEEDEQAADDDAVYWKESDDEEEVDLEQAEDPERHTAEGVKTSQRLDNDGLFQGLSEIYDKAEALATTTPMPIVVTAILTTGHRYYVVSLTKFDVNNDTKPLLQFHGKVHMRVLRQIAVDNVDVDGFEYNHDDLDRDFPIDQVEVERVILAHMVVISGMLRQEVLKEFESRKSEARETSEMQESVSTDLTTPFAGTDSTVSGPDLGLSFDEKIKKKSLSFVPAPRHQSSSISTEPPGKKTKKY